MKTTLIASLSLGLLSLLPHSLHAGWNYRQHSDRGSHDRAGDRHGGSGIGFFWAGVAIGSVFRSPPPRCAHVIINGIPYEYHEGVYYRSCRGGYVVVDPPVRYRTYRR